MPSRSPKSVESPLENPLRAIHAEFHGSDTGITIEQKLIARGFKVRCAAKAETRDPAILRMTIVFEDCDERQFAQALMQIQGIVTVIRAAEISVDDVSQHIQVRLPALEREKRRELRRVGAHIDENVFFQEIAERRARSATRGVSSAIENTGTKIIGADRKISVGESGHQGAVATVQIRVRDVRENVRNTIEELGGAFEGPIKIHYKANPRLIDRFRKLINELGVEPEELLIGPPNVNSTKLLDKKEG